MGKSKNSNINRGTNSNEGRKKVLVLAPKASNPKLLARTWEWQ